MKNWHFLIIYSVISATIMIVVDYIIGSKAEFINAFSVVQRLVGQIPTAGESMVARNYGATGELVAVVVIHLMIGLLLTVLTRLLRRAK